jgi:hypothetical protein
MELTGRHGDYDGNISFDSEWIEAVPEEASRAVN